MVTNADKILHILYIDGVRGGAYTENIVTIELLFLFTSIFFDTL